VLWEEGKLSGRSVPGELERFIEKIFFPDTTIW
jgi:hypothetical protein